MPTINSFKGEYNFLSNFWYVDVVYANQKYPTVEHAFQAAKTLSIPARAQIKHAPTPSAAKALGKAVELRYDWDDMKIHVMRSLLTQKFKYGDLRRRLIETGENELIEGNTWHGNYWGVCSCHPCRCLIHYESRHNVLGKLLMELRKNIQYGLTY